MFSSLATTTTSFRTASRNTQNYKNLLCRSSKRVISSSTIRLADPWPLPGTPEHLASTATPSDEARIKPLERRNESLETLRARLVYQSRKRGTLESDLLLATFARDNLSVMTEIELKEYDKLLDEPDWDIYYWATGKRTPPERWADSALLKRLSVHAKNEGKVVRRMPSL
ncbi:Flavinator of succinate dehydrogenase-domain-containing protein [Rhodocollybia butyracea]|uniref:Succinate dehydrogenase assembly factor 2, mitochondrial n=1 Tax=Rhodocollybia butyracea TaxID=206335 RepID=A0A9P5Q016_9AGAR|nr:Flavinator of succinate dehydrogenase-domain-containing protein [Rhodocollybia butyracea]